jgi:hypothetical protein
MAITQIDRRNVKLGRPTEVLWDSFRRGLNLLLQDIELNKEEVRKTEELVLKGAGILTPRPGTANYYQAGSGKVRGMRPYYSKAGSSELLTITDSGYLTKKLNASHSIIPGASFPSGTEVSMAQIYNSIYIASPTVALRKYDGTSLYTYTGISTPTSLAATKSSGATGSFTWSWRVGAESDLAETLASVAVSLSNLPEDLTTTQYVTLSWPSVTNARGYVIYGRDAGNETYLTRIPPTSTSWVDDGSSISSTFTFPPESDFTAGPKGKVIITFKEKLVVANLENNPSRVMCSGGGPNVDKFHWSKGGFYIDINKDDGEEVEGALEYENKIIVWKTRSVYQITISYNSSLGIVEPTVQKISGAVGSVAYRTIQSVENDVFFVGRRAGGGVSLNSLGYEPNFSQVLRTSEISPRVRPELSKINMARISEMWAVYWKSIYWLFYPVGASSMKCLGYDRERLAWLGPFSFPNSPAVGTVYYDSTDAEHFVYGDGDDGFVTEVSDGYANDKGTNFTWMFLSKKEFLGEPFRLKNLSAIFTHLRNVTGTVAVSLIVEDTAGVTSTAASFTVTGQSTLAGFGSFAFGTERFGYQPSSGTSNLSEIIKYIQLNKSRIRSYQVQISGTGALAEIVAIKGLLTTLSPLTIGSSWRVSS